MTVLIYEPGKYQTFDNGEWWCVRRFYRDVYYSRYWSREQALRIGHGEVKFYSEAIQV